MSDYILDLRKIVGHRTLMQCAASIICINEQGELLLGKRSDNHCWAYSGGSVEIDERVEDAARRELYEEMNLTADELIFYTISSGPETHYTYPNGDEVSNVEIVYLCRKYHGTPRPQAGEMDELQYFAPADIDPEMISPPTRPVVKKLLEELTKANMELTCEE